MNLKSKLSTYETDPSKFTTFRNTLLYAGAFNEGTWKSKFFIFYRHYCLFVGLLLYSKKILRDVSNDFLAVVEAFHYMSDYIIVITMNVPGIYYHRLFDKMESIIKNGYFDYEGHLTQEQIKVRADMNRNIQLMSKLYFFLAYIGLAATFMKGFFKEYQLPYPMWIPYTINNLYEYIGTLLHVFIMAETLTFCSFANWSAFLAFSCHLIAQYKILIIAIKEIDIIDKKEAPNEKESLMLSKLKFCVQHHNIIIRFFEDMQIFFALPLLISALLMAVSFCTLGFIIIAPGATVVVIGGLLLLFLPEILVIGNYSFFGQKISDLCEEFSETIYNSEWFTKPPSVQKILHMIQIGSLKNRQLNALGLHTFSMKGLSEIIKAAFSYFNMLMAMK